MTQRGRDPGPPGRPGGGGRPGYRAPAARVMPGRGSAARDRDRDRDRDRGRAERGAARLREVPPPGRDGTRAARTGGAGARGLGDATVRSGYAEDKSGSRAGAPEVRRPAAHGPGRSPQAAAPPAAAPVHRPPRRAGAAARHHAAGHRVRADDLRRPPGADPGDGVRLLQQGGEPAAAEDERAARGARHDLRRGRADPGDDRGDIPGVGGPPADNRQAGGRAAAGRPARDAGRAAPGPPPAPDVTAVRGARQGRVRRQRGGDLGAEHHRRL